MWHDHPFSQRNRTMKRAVGMGLDKMGMGSPPPPPHFWLLPPYLVKTSHHPTTAIFEKSHPPFKIATKYVECKRKNIGTSRKSVCIDPFSYKNIVYKNSEAQICQNVRII